MTQHHGFKFQEKFLYFLLCFERYLRINYHVIMRLDLCDFLEMNVRVVDERRRVSRSTFWFAARDCEIFGRKGEETTRPSGHTPRLAAPSLAPSPPLPLSPRGVARPGGLAAYRTNARCGEVRWAPRPLGLQGAARGDTARRSPAAGATAHCAPPSPAPGRLEGLQ